jgi:hypothetical protein
MQKVAKSAPSGNENFVPPRPPGNSGEDDAPRSKLEHALDLAHRFGFRVFPLAPNSKVPLYANWKELATTDEAVIRRYWAAEPDANIGIQLIGWMVIDVDPRNGGFESLLAFKEAHDLLDETLPKTLVSETWSGGRHVFFRLPEGQRVKNRAHALGKGIDVKSGEGGLVVGPGSTINGKPYRWLSGAETVAQLAADWLVREAGRARDKDPNAGVRVVEEDDEARERAERYVEDQAPTAERGARDNTAVAVANRLYDFGVTEATCRELLWAWNCDKVSPPLEMADIERVAGSAARSRQRPIGCDSPNAPAFDEWPIDESKAPSNVVRLSDRRAPAAVPTPGYDAAWAYINDQAPDEDDMPDQDAAAKVVARVLRQHTLTGEQVVDLMREWSLGAYDRPLSDEDLLRAVEQTEPSATPSSTPRASVVTGAAPPVRAPGSNARVLTYCTFASAAADALTEVTEPLIEGLLEQETLSVVYGDTNVGKSFTEMDKDFHIAAGIEWAGRKVKQGAVVWVAAEGGRGVLKRVEALRRRYMRDDVPFFIVRSQVNLRDPNAELRPLITLVHQIEAEHGMKVVKVTIDTLSQVLAGGDENGPVDMGSLVKNLGTLKEQCKTHVAVIHHSGHSRQGARGHSLLRAAIDTEIEVGSGTMKVTKQRDLETNIELRFKLRPVRIGTDVNGNPVTSCWVEMVEKADFEAELTPLQIEIAEAIGANGTPDTPFTNIDALRWHKGAENPDHSQKEAMRQQLKALLDAGWLHKPRPNRYLLTDRARHELGLAAGKDASERPLASNQESTGTQAGQAAARKAAKGPIISGKSIH